MAAGNQDVLFCADKSQQLYVKGELKLTHSVLQLLMKLLCPLQYRRRAFGNVLRHLQHQ